MDKSSDIKGKVTFISIQREGALRNLNPMEENKIIELFRVTGSN